MAEMPDPGTAVADPRTAPKQQHAEPKEINAVVYGEKQQGPTREDLEIEKVRKRQAEEEREEKLHRDIEAARDPNGRFPKEPGPHEHLKNKITIENIRSGKFNRSASEAVSRNVDMFASGLSETSKKIAMERQDKNGKPIPGLYAFPGRKSTSVNAPPRSTKRVEITKSRGQSPAIFGNFSIPMFSQPKRGKDQPSGYNLGMDFRSPFSRKKGK